MENNPEARLLARLVSDLSEDYWCAGWLSECEYALWADVTGTEVLGHKGWSISQADKEELQIAQKLADGWVIWLEEDADPKFLTLTAWLAHLEIQSRVTEN